jgi:hypothetical protein
MKNRDGMGTVKRILCAAAGVIVFGGVLFAQATSTVLPNLPDGAILYADEDFDGIDAIEDDEPYLSEEDEASIAAVLPEDTPENPVQEQSKPAQVPSNRREAPKFLYHLLVLDRLDCPSSDTREDRDLTVLYKFRHGTNGYLIMLYRTPAADGSMLPGLPDGSRIVLNLNAISTSVLKDYINSSAFRRHVTHRTVLAELQRLL